MKTHRDESEWMAAYKKMGALWFHEGNPKQAHALLTSGNHSNGFFNSRIVTEDEELLFDAAADLIEHFKFAAGRKTFFLADVFVGPQTGATKLAKALSHQATMCDWISPAKSEAEGKKSMVLTEAEAERIRGQHVVLCEDVLTTGGSVKLTADAVKAAGGKILPFVLVLVNRTGLKEVKGLKIVALINKELPIWTPDQCPLCKQGSEAVRPKDNWKRLHEVT